MGELTTLQPDPAFDAEAHEETVSTFEAVADDLTVKVWGGDWCGDCRSQLPGFGAAMDAAGVSDVEHYPVEKEEDGTKVGPKVKAYDIELIPTVVLELDGEEVARFVEEEPVPPAQYLAERLREAGYGN